MSSSNDPEQLTRSDDRCHEQHDWRQLIGSEIEPSSWCYTELGLFHPTNIVRFSISFASLRYGHHEPGKKRSKEKNQDHKSQSGQVKDRFHFLSPLREHTDFVDRGIKVGIQSRFSALDNKWFRSAILLLITYLTLKNIILAALQARRDHLSTLIEPSLRENATRTTKCALKSDIYLDETSLAISNQIDLIDSVLDFTGSSLMSLFGIGAALQFVLGLVPIVFFYLSIYFIHWRQVEADMLGFLLDPLGEYLKAQKEISAIIRKLINFMNQNFNVSGQSIEQISEQNCNILEKFARRKSNLLEEAGKVCGLKELTVSHSDRMGTITANPQQSRNIKTASYINMLVSIKFYELVRPANLSDSWHRNLLKFNRLVSITNWIFFIIPGFSIYAYSIIAELRTRAQHRSDQFECQNWQPTGVPIKGVNYLPQLDSQWDIEAYNSSYSNSRSSLYLLQIEARHLFSPLVILRGIELNLLIVLNAIWASFFFSLYTFTYLDWIVWASQIEEQLDYCCRLLEEFSWFHEKNGSESARSSRLGEIMKIITLTYVNFELFRQRQRKFRLLIDFLLLQGALTACGVFLLCYIVGSSSNSGYNTILLLLTTYTLIFVDCFLVSAAIRTSRLNHLMRSIHKLNTKAALNFIEGSPIFVLWRRQLLEEEEARMFFANRFLRIYLSYNRLLTVHIYLLALYLVLFRVKITNGQV